MILVLFFKIIAFFWKASHGVVFVLSVGFPASLSIAIVMLSKKC